MARQMAGKESSSASMPACDASTGRSHQRTDASPRRTLNPPSPQCSDSGWRRWPEPNTDRQCVGTGAGPRTRLPIANHRSSRTSTPMLRIRQDVVSPIGRRRRASKWAHPRRSGRGKFRPCLCTRWQTTGQIHPNGHLPDLGHVGVEPSSTRRTVQLLLEANQEARLIELARKRALPLQFVANWTVSHFVLPVFWLQTRRGTPGPKCSGPPEPPPPAQRD